jgi:hypothetical protein
VTAPPLTARPPSLTIGQCPRSRRPAEVFRRPEERRPHPDQRVEAALQRVIVFRRMTTEKERQVRHDRRLIRRLDRAVGRRRSMDFSGRARLADALRQEVRDVEREILELQDAIADQVNELGADNMLWL